MAAIVRLEHEVAMTGKPIDIGDVALGRPVLRGRDVAMVEDDHGPTAGRLASVWHRQQPEDLEAVGPIRRDVAAVVAARSERLLDGEVASRIIALAHRVDGEWIEGLVGGQRRRPRCGRRREDRYGGLGPT